jgi:hypothetical protein
MGSQGSENKCNSAKQSNKIFEVSNGQLVAAQKLQATRPRELGLLEKSREAFFRDDRNVYICTVEDCDASRMWDGLDADLCAMSDEEWSNMADAGNHSVDEFKAELRYGAKVLRESEAAGMDVVGDNSEERESDEEEDSEEDEEEDS